MRSFACASVILCLSNVVACGSSDRTYVEKEEETAGAAGSSSATTTKGQGGTTSNTMSRTSTSASGGTSEASSVPAGGTSASTTGSLPAGGTVATSGGTTAAAGTSTAAGTTASGGTTTASGGTTAKGGTTASGGATTASGGKTTAGGSSASGGTTTSTTAATCSTSTATCRVAPAGWKGPVLLVTGASSAIPACPATAPSSAFSAYSALTSAAAQCGCSCAAPASSQLSCGEVTLGYAGDCFSPTTVLARVSEGQCYSMMSSLPTSATSWLVSEPAFSATGSCTAQPTRTIPTPTWAASHRACTLPETCGTTGMCIPPLGTNERACVYISGDATCPSSYPSQLKTASSYTDTRTCSACTCGSITGSCSGGVKLQNDSCVGFQFPLATLNIGCNAPQGISLPYTVRRDIVASGSCTPSASTASGGVTPDNVQTVCCTP